MNPYELYSWLGWRILISFFNPNPYFTIISPFNNTIKFGLQCLDTTKVFYLTQCKGNSSKNFYFYFASLKTSIKEEKSLLDCWNFWDNFSSSTSNSFSIDDLKGLYPFSRDNVYWAMKLITFVLMLFSKSVLVKLINASILMAKRMPSD